MKKNWSPPGRVRTVQPLKCSSFIWRTCVFLSPNPLMVSFKIIWSPPVQINLSSAIPGLPSLIDEVHSSQLKLFVVGQPVTSQLSADRSRYNYCSTENFYGGLKFDIISFSWQIIVLSADKCTGMDIVFNWKHLRWVMYLVSWKIRSQWRFSWKVWRRAQRSHQFFQLTNF